MAQELSLEQQQKLNRLMARAAWQRTTDIGVDILVPKIVPSATSTKADWVKFNVDVPSVFQLLSAGADVSHLIYVTHSSPDDTMVSQGRCKRNEVGRGYCMAVGDYWVYVPQLTGDPAFFTARLSDASSELPSAATALDAGGAAPGVMIVSTLNRAAGFTDQKTVAVVSTAENLPAHAVPNGCAVVISALTTNSQDVGIGFSAAAADLVTGTPKRLSPGASVSFRVNNSNLLWVDALVAGEGVDIAAES